MPPPKDEASQLRALMLELRDCTDPKRRAELDREINRLMDNARRRG